MRHAASRPYRQDSPIPTLSGSTAQHRRAFRDRCAVKKSGRAGQPVPVAKLKDCNVLRAFHPREGASKRRETSPATASSFALPYPIRRDLQLVPAEIKKATSAFGNGACQTQRNQSTAAKNRTPLPSSHTLAPHPRARPKSSRATGRKRVTCRPETYTARDRHNTYQVCTVSLVEQNPRFKRRKKDSKFRVG